MIEKTPLCLSTIYWGARCKPRTTMHDRAVLIRAKPPQELRTSMRLFLSSAEIYAQRLSDNSTIDPQQVGGGQPCLAKPV